MSATQVPTAAKVRELQRELGIRRAFYPKLIERGKLGQEEASYRIEVLDAILADYLRRAKDERHTESTGD
jgi:hypothetical protein